MPAEINENYLNDLNVTFSHFDSSDIYVCSRIGGLKGKGARLFTVWPDLS